MITKGNSISIRLSINATIAWNYLKDKKVCPDKYLRDGGEKLVIDKARKFGLSLRIKKIYIPF